MPAPLSIIIPTLDAERHLPSCLVSLMPGLEAGLIREVIISDGGSEDQTLKIADQAGANIVTGLAGRGQQLAKGAETARGNWFLFLHADTVLSDDWVACCQRHMDTRPGNAATFHLAYRSNARSAARLAKRANFRTRNLGLSYGDQGLLISRALYNSVGGYRDLTLFEDIALIREIGKRRLDMLPARAHTSAEKYEFDGWQRRSRRNFWLTIRYFLGADPEKLAQNYDRSLSERAEPATTKTDPQRHLP